MNAEQRQIREELLDLREEAVQKITQKNRLRLALERLQEQLGSTNLSERKRIETEIARLEPHFAKADAEAARLKSEVWRREDEGCPYAREHRGRALELLREIEDIVIRSDLRSEFENHTRRLIDSVAAYLRSYYEACEKPDAEKPVPTLEDIREATKPVRMAIASEWAERKRNLIGHLEDELESLKTKEARDN